MSSPLLASLVIPAFNEARRLPSLLESLAAELRGLPPVELVVVDDGSAEAHRAEARAAVETLVRALEAGGGGHRARFVGYSPNRGKGFAVRTGWKAAADAAWLGFLDADGATPAREVARLLRMLPTFEADVLAASRVKMGGRRVERSALRHYQGRVFATVADLVFRLDLYDTQCGAKLFRAAALRPVLDELTEERWLLDLEILALLRARGASVIEVPIDWADPGGSKLRPGIDAARMLQGIFRIKRAHRL